MKKLILLSLLLINIANSTAQQWRMWVDQCVEIKSETVNSIGFKALVTSTDFNKFQLFIANSYAILPSKKYRMQFDIQSTGPFTLRSRFGNEQYEHGNYFIDFIHNTDTGKQAVTGPVFETGTQLISNLHLYFQSNDIRLNTEVMISNIRFQEVVPTEMMVVETDSIVYDLMGSPFRADSEALINGWQEWGRHEGTINVSSKYDWSEGARPADWMSPGTFKAITSWGHIVEDRNGSVEQNARIQIRNHKMYILNDTDWKEVEDVTSSLESKVYTIDYLSRNVDPGLRVESPGTGGGVSVATHSNSILHWWRKLSEPISRVSLSGSEKAIFVRCEMRLIQNETNTANLRNARFYGGVGADYYPEVTSEACPGEYCTGLLCSRLKLITEEWRVFTALVIEKNWPVRLTAYKQAVQGLSILPPYVKRSNVTSVASHQQTTIKLRYEKAHQRLYVDGAPETLGYTIVAVDGRICAREMYDASAGISTVGWQPGVYVVILNVGEQVVVRKVGV